MTKDADPVISAQVLLKPASGVQPRDRDITAANIASLEPAADVVREVTGALARAGFDVGPVVGPTFSITAVRSVFDRFFGITGAGRKTGEITLAHVPARLRDGVAAITFPPPPDFGPRSYS